MDHACIPNSKFQQDRWLVLSSEGCPNSWGSDSRPASKCPQAFVFVEEDVVEVAVANGNFKTLVNLLTDLELVDKLKGLTAQTIFAPSDEAFSKLPDGTLDRLTTKQKKAIVLRHVVEGVTILAADVKSGPIETIGGEFIDLKNYNEGHIEYDEEGVQIYYKNNRIDVAIADVMASNGVIHVIDKVILPSKFPTFNTFLHFFQNQHI